MKNKIYCAVHVHTEYKCNLKKEKLFAERQNTRNGKRDRESNVEGA